MTKLRAAVRGRFRLHQVKQNFIKIGDNFGNQFVKKKTPSKIGESTDSNIHKSYNATGAKTRKSIFILLFVVSSNWRSRFISTQFYCFNILIVNFYFIAIVLNKIEYAEAIDAYLQVQLEF